MHSLHNIFPNVGALPAAWKTELFWLGATAYPFKPVLSGGALRDHFHGAEVKDLDVFLPYGPGLVSAIDAALQSSGWLLTQSIPPSCAGLGEVVEVRGYQKDGETDLNIIFLDPGVDYSALGVAQRNDFGICQIAAWIEDDEWRFEYTDAFIEDVMAKTFTLLREGDEARSLRRYERLKEKYPDHTLVTPNITPTTNLLPI
ncbi:hypothetical protein [Rhizobium sp. NFACC06-2]|uniref:hypothetical protein n=1 Tax=Rhizobium sp. NFACC06-2 TaxID=1566264 RepID=UPI000876B97E|nr:hypothetical protein [Rhizobium sp. NFACC06-2]SCY04953.1 hypothetical protein SAMN03159288_01153 [Rhizobium sp. NFACC06-2]